MAPRSARGSRESAEALRDGLTDCSLLPVAAASSAIVSRRSLSKSAMPSSATLQQKFLMLWQALTTGGPHSANVQILSAAAIPIAKTIADCGKFIGTLDGLNGPVTFETVFCTLPVDAGGIFKLVLIDAEVPSSLAKQERATAEAVLASYRVDPAALRQMLMPYNSPPAPAGSGSSDPDALRAQLQRNRNQQRMIDQQFQCYEAGVMREEPEWRLPPYCH